MQLSDYKSMCKYHGWRDTTTDGEAALTRFINNTIYILSTLVLWPEYLKRDGEVAMIVGTDSYILSETGIDRIGTVEKSDNTLPLCEMSVEDWLERSTTVEQTGTPTSFAIEQSMTNGASSSTMLVYPTPTEIETLYYTYFRRPAEMAIDADYADWPDDRAWLVEEALEKRLAAGKKDVTGWSLHDADFMAKVLRAAGNARGSYKPIKVRSVMTERSKGRIRDTYWRIID